MDIVYIRQLRVDAIIGVYELERQLRQPVVLNIDMAANIAKAAETDDIAMALDYHAVSIRLTDFVEKSEFNLIETMAEQCAKILQDEFSVTWCRVDINKPNAVDNTDTVGVLIERSLD